MTGRMGYRMAAMLALTGVALAAPAQAGFEIVGTVPQPQAPVASAPVTAPAPQDVVTGFGRDLPVEVVAAQVIPPEFTIAFTADVDRARTASWTGGQDWRIVLANAIQPLGLKFDETGTEVLIQPARRGPDPIAPLASQDPVATPTLSEAAPLDPNAISQPIVEPAQAAVLPAFDLAAGADEATQLADLSPVQSVLPATQGADPNALLADIDPSADAAVIADRLAGGDLAAANSDPNTDDLLASLPASNDPNGLGINDSLPVDTALPETQVAAAHSGHAGPAPDAAFYKENHGAAVPHGGLRWSAHSGSTLKRTLEDWAATAGWTVAWQSNLDYRLQAGGDFEGDFLQASGNLLRTFGRAEPPVRATFYRGNRVVVVDVGFDSIN